MAGWRRRSWTRGAAAGAGVKGWVCPVVKGEGREEVVGGPGPWVLWDVEGGSLVLRGHRKAAEACMLDTFPVVKIRTKAFESPEENFISLVQGKHQ